MISALQLSYELDQRLNKLSTFAHQQIPIEDKVIALCDAQIKLVKLKLSGNNVYKLGLDAFKKRYQDLEFLVENFEDHALVPILADKYLNRYGVSTSQLTPAFMFYIDSYMVADKGLCKDRVLYTDADLVKHADITTLLNNTNYKPSFEYQSTIVDISSDELHYYTDGTFSPKKVYVSYLRYPKNIDLAGYVKFDGTDSADVDSEFEEYLKNELLDLAVQQLGTNTENTPAVQGAQVNKQDNE